MIPKLLPLFTFARSSITSANQLNSSQKKEINILIKKIITHYLICKTESNKNIHLDSVKYLLKRSRDNFFNTLKNLIQKAQDYEKLPSDEEVQKVIKQQMNNE